MSEEIELDPEHLAAIDRGLADVKAGRTVPLEEVRKLSPIWIAKFEARKKGQAA